jgi:pimeloyl-ACP methyl ester carboxylesterase
VLEPIMGRYLRLTLDGRPHRVYFEEAGQGWPLVCLHTAGADGRQFRHLMTDAAVTRDWRVLAFDMPRHGKSLPPAGWQDEEYRLTTAAYVELILGFSDALGLARPVVLGCSIGGKIVLELALRAPSASAPSSGSRPRPTRRRGTTTPRGSTALTSTAGSSAAR